MGKWEEYSLEKQRRVDSEEGDREEGQEDLTEIGNMNPGPAYVLFPIPN